MKKEQVIKAAAIAAVILISGVFYTVKQQSETGAAKAAVVHTEESVTQEETENTQNVTGQEEPTYLRAVDTKKQDLKQLDPTEYIEPDDAYETAGIWKH